MKCKLSLFFAINSGGLNAEHTNGVYTYTLNFSVFKERLKKLKYDLNIAAQENALKHKRKTQLKSQK